jgi:3-(3-hydroxy-phenyl)propionate hydroxylase
MRLDDVMGPGAWLIGRAQAPQRPGLNAAILSDPWLAPFADSLKAWLDAHRADAVLVRPDRTVFGTGAPESLADAYAAFLAG